MGNITSSRGTQELPDTIEAIEYYYRKGLTDGLPVIPPTPERVEEFLHHARRRPDDVLGVIQARSRTITAQKVAINSIMAGCLPEYGPVVVAAVEAMVEEPFNLHATTASTTGLCHLLIVHGPIARELDINSSTNLFGPTRRSNATIGRAIRLVLMNVCGAVPDELDKATFGHPGKYSYCIAENEELSPWSPLHVDRGLPREASAVTVFACRGPLQHGEWATSDPERILDGVAHLMTFQVSIEPGSRGEFVIVIAPELAEHIANAGWSKRQVQEYLFGATKEVNEGGGPAVEGPDDLMVIVAGGPGGPYFCSIQSGVDKIFTHAITRPIVG